MKILEEQEFLRIVEQENKIPEEYKQYVTDLIFKGSTFLDLSIANMEYRVATLTGEEQVHLTAVTEDLLIELSEEESQRDKHLLNKYATILGRIVGYKDETGEYHDFVASDEIQEYYKHKTKDLFRSRILTGLKMSEIVLDALYNKYSQIIAQLFYVLNRGDLKNS